MYIYIFAGSSCVTLMFSQNRALNAISMASGRARPTVLSSYVIAYKDVIRLWSSHILSRWLTFSATTRFALWKKLLFSRCTNEDTLTTKQLGLPRPNVSIQQVSTKGGKSYIQELERKKNAAVKWLTRSVFHIPPSLFIGFTVCFTVRFLH